MRFPRIISGFLVWLCLISPTYLHSQAETEEAAPTTPPAPLFDKPIDQLTADEVLKLVRTSYTLYNKDFTGTLQSNQMLLKKINFLMSLKTESIRFIFNEPAQTIYLDTKGENFALMEGIDGQELTPVSPEKFGQPIRGTDVTYDDLSMRFLYWPDAKIDALERIKQQDCWVVGVRNPDGAGSYATVRIWIDKATGGMLKMMGYNKEGRPIRRFEVISAKKFDDIWMVDEMRIETLSPGAGSPITSSTRMSIKGP
jgi:Outer membrane lipoprotein-sorting protein